MPANETFFPTSIFQEKLYGYKLDQNLQYKVHYAFPK